MRYSYLILVLLVFKSNAVLAQSSDTLALSTISTKSVKEVRQTERFQKSDKFKKANEMYALLGYQRAAAYYENVEGNLLDIEQIDQLANAARLNNQTQDAEAYYAKLVSVSTNPEYYLRYAQMLQSNKKCEDATRWFKKYKSAAPDSNREFQMDCRFDFQYSWHPEASVSNFEAVNSEELDFAATPFGEDLIITSNRKYRSAVARKDLWTMKNFTDLFVVREGENQENEIKPLRGGMSKKFHDGAASFARENTEVFFTRNDEQGKNEEGEIRLKIYASNLEKDKWSTPRELQFNDSKYSCAHPALSPDGDAMVFASDQPGGFGGMDLFISFRTQGEWGEAQNLGPEVNSGGNELFPYWAKDGKLYYASEGHKGMGGLDVFMIQYQVAEGENSWAERKHLGIPINSTKDDFAFYIDSSNTKGYLSSDREGGMGADDIYKWNAPQGLKFFEPTTIIVRNKETKEVIQQVQVFYQCVGLSDELKNKENEIPEFLLKQQSLVTGLEGQAQMKSHPYLYYEFKVALNDYEPYENILDGKNMHSDTPVYLDLTPIIVVDRMEELPTIDNIRPKIDLMVGKVFQMKDIYYDFDKYDIRFDASSDLNKLTELMFRYPEMKIQLEAHTDSRGKKSYNRRLSKNRVKSAKQYLVKKGVSAKRMTTAHFGESKLINGCSDGVKCSEAEHQENRRTEVRVMSMKK